MWPFESGRDVLRIGRQRIEHWRSVRDGMTLVAAEPLTFAGNATAAALSAAVRTLSSESSSGATASGLTDRAVHLVVESAWLPLLLLETGRKPLRDAQVGALLRHRLDLAFADRREPAAEWHVHADYRAGDSCCLGYGLAASVKLAIEDAARAAGIRLASLQPALPWGLRFLGRRALRNAWWLWLEQDRALICRISGPDRVVAFNGAGSIPRDDSDVRRLVEIEAIRQGVAQGDGRTVVAGWQEAAREPNEAGDPMWFSVQAAYPDAEYGAATELRAGSAA